MDSSDQSGSEGGRRYLAVARRLLSAIQQDVYRPGERLPADRELAERFGVSRPTAREAILALELVGAITVRHGDGTYVADPGARFLDRARIDFGASPREVMQARITVEPPVSALLTQHADAASLAEIQRELDEAAALVDDVSALPTFVDYSLRFHARLAALCRNPILNHVVSELVDVDSQPLWALVNQLALRTRASRVTAIREHQAILDTVAAGDPAAAERAMREHLLANERHIFFPDSSSHHQRTGS